MQYYNMSTLEIIYEPQFLKKGRKKGRKEILLIL